MSDLAKLREQRNAVVTAMNDLLKRGEAQEHGFTGEDDAAWARQVADIEAIDKKLERAEKLATYKAAAPSVRELLIETNERADVADRGKQQRELFGRYIRSGFEDMSKEDRAAILAPIDPKETRAFSAGTSNVGGATVPQGFWPVLEQVLRATGAMWGIAEIIKTDKGNQLPYPTFDYTAQAATIIGEGSASSVDATTPFGATTFLAYTYRSPLLQVSWEYLDDTAFSEDYIVRALTESIARGSNAHFTTGTGTGQPLGVTSVVTGATTAATGNTLLVPYDNIVDLLHSVDPAYRTPGDVSIYTQSKVSDFTGNVHMSAGFMMRDATVAIIRKLKDTANMPIWKASYEAGVTTGVPDTLLGFPVYINQDMPAAAANAYSIAFGRLNKYKVRVVQDYRLLRLTERYADNGQVAFTMFLRADGRPIQTTTPAIRLYRHSAT